MDFFGFHSGQYLNLDTDHNGMLSKEELKKYGLVFPSFLITKTLLVLLASLFSSLASISYTMNKTESGYPVSMHYLSWLSFHVCSNWLIIYKRRTGQCYSISTAFGWKLIKFITFFVFFFSRYGTGTLTNAFLDRVFQECLTYEGEMV